MIGWLLSLFRPQVEALQARSPLWPAKRREHIRREPCCQACGAWGDLEVHHLWPVSFPNGKEAELVDANLITMCRACHLEHGHSFDYAARNVHCREDCARMRSRIRLRQYPKDVT